MTPSQLALQKTQPNISNSSMQDTFPSPAKIYPSMSGEESIDQAPSFPNAAQQAIDQQSQSQTGSVDFNVLKKEGYSDVQIEGYLSQNPGIQLENAPKDWNKNIQQDAILSSSGPITETFGERQPGVEVFSGGFTSGTGIGVPVGTKIALPPGQWKVINMVNNARQKGFIGDADGEGWGNNILVQNTKTGEYLRYSHLSQIDVSNGDTINGSRVIGLSGQSGNVTGPHLNLEYITPNGQPADVLKSQYAPYIPISQ